MSNNILISLSIILFIIYFTHINTQSKLYNIYNPQDEISACDPICTKQGKKFTDYKNGKCVCSEPIQLKTTDEHMASTNISPFVANIELYTNITDPTTFLEPNTPHDEIFNNRNVLQKHEKDRYSSLIFG